MFSIKTTFTAAVRGPGPDLLWLLFWFIVIIDDGDRRAKQRRERHKTPPVKPQGPTP